MKITLGERTAKTAAIYFEQANCPEIRAVLPQKAKTLEEALADFQETQRPGSSSFGRTVWIGRDYVGDIWCYCMDPAGTPNGMVSYCLFKPEFWGKGVMSRALDLFLAELRTRFPWLNTVGAFLCVQHAVCPGTGEKRLPADGALHRGRCGVVLFSEMTKNRIPPGAILRVGLTDYIFVHQQNAIKRILG